MLVQNFINKNYPSTTSEIASFLGSFWGAFFAFIFGLMAYRITKRWERFVLHKNSLIKLERICNRHLDNLFLFEGEIPVIIKALQNNGMNSNRMFKLDIPENLDIDIGSVEIINELFSYQGDINRLNFTISSINHFLTRFEDWIISGKPANNLKVDLVFESLGDLQQEYLPKVIKHLENLYVLVRISLKKINVAQSFFYGISKTSWDFKISSCEVEDELKKLKEEIRLKQEIEQNRK